MNWETVSIGVFIVVGLIEYVKGFAKDAPSWIWRVAVVPLSLLVALSVEYLPPFVVVALVIIAAAQLGYEVIVESVRKRLRGSE
ncbi:MAG: hypothetical protein ACOC2N_00025 [Spirochaetota bacterium]